MATYIGKIETIFRKTNKFSGQMDDCVSNLEELKNRSEWYEEGMLIWVEDEQKVYKSYKKETLILEK